MADYTSSFTGAEIDAAVSKVKDITSTAANIDAATAIGVATTDYVVAQSISSTIGTWSWRKWNSGAVDLWYEYTFDVANATKTTFATSGVYTESVAITLPFAVTNGIVTGCAQNLWCFSNAYTGTLNDNPVCGFRLWRMTDNTTETPVRIYVFGRWK